MARIGHIKVSPNIINPSGLESDHYVDVWVRVRTSKRPFALRMTLAEYNNASASDVVASPRERLGTVVSGFTFWVKEDHGRLVLVSLQGKYFRRAKERAEKQIREIEPLDRSWWKRLLESWGIY